MRRKKIVKLTESDLVTLVNRLINEEMSGVFTKKHKYTFEFNKELDENTFEIFSNLLELQVKVKGYTEGPIKSGQTRKFIGNIYDMKVSVECNKKSFEVFFDAVYGLWNLYPLSSVKINLTKQSSDSLSSKGITISQKSSKNFLVETTLWDLRSDPTQKIDISTGISSTPSGGFPFCVTGPKFEKGTNKNGDIYTDKDGLFVFFNNKRVMFDKQSEGKKRMGNYTCMDGQKNYPHTISTNEYDSIYEYKVEFDDDGKVVKVETKQIKKSNWIDVSNNDKYKKPILEKVFGIKN
jgi:hypothetical protein